MIERKHRVIRASNIKFMLYRNLIYQLRRNVSRSYQQVAILYVLKMVAS